MAENKYIKGQRNIVALPRSRRLREAGIIASSSTTGSGGTVAGGISEQQVRALISSIGKTLFLSRIYDDEASGLISFLRGARIPAGQSLLFGSDDDGVSVGYDNDHKALRFDGNIYATGQISALGPVTVESGGSLLLTLGQLTNVVDSADDIHSTDKVLVRLANSSQWTLKNLSEIGGGGSGSMGDLSKYVTLDTEQTITGVKTFKSSILLSFPEDSSKVMGIAWRNKANTDTVASIYAHNTAKRIILTPINSSEVWVDKKGNYSLILGENELTYNTYPILRTDNFSSLIGDFVKKSGDTMTGSLTLSAGNFQVSNGNIYATGAYGGCGINPQSGFFGTDVANNNTYTLGRSASRWSNVYSVLGNFSGAVTAQRINIIGTANSDAHLTSDTAGTFYMSANGVIPLVINGVGKSLYPIGSNTFTFGTSNSRWSGVYSVLGNFSGRITASGVDSDKYFLRFENNASSNALISIYAFVGHAWSFGQYASDFGFSHNALGRALTISGTTGDINAAGNITASITSTLDKYARVANSNGSVEILASTNRGLYDVTKSSWIIATNGTNTWLPQGNIGIGTTTPVEKLQVIGSLRTNGLTTDDRYVLVGSSIYCVAPSSGGWAMGISQRDSNGNSIAQIAGAYGNGNTPSYTFFGGSGYSDAAMYILPNKNIGIGISSPSEKLHVNGNMLLYGSVRSYGTYFHEADTTYTAKAMAGMYIWRNHLQITKRTTANIYESGLIDFNLDTLNIGIGLENASAKLHVSGNILASGEITALSDARTKFNVDTLKYRGSARPVRYVKDGKLSIGFIAQEVEVIYPELVGTTNDGMKTLNYMGYTAVLQAQIDALQNEVTKLKNALRHG